MPSPKDELRETLPGRMAALGVQPTNLAELVGISPQHLSNFLSGRRDLDIQDVVKIRNIMSELESLANICNPIPVNFKNLQAIRQLLLTINDLKVTVRPDDYPKLKSMVYAAIQFSLGREPKLYDGNKDEYVLYFIPTGVTGLLPPAVNKDDYQSVAKHFEFISRIKHLLNAFDSGLRDLKERRWT